MSTIQVRVEDLIGSVGDTTLITDSVNDTIKEIVNGLPKDALWKIADDFADAGSGIATDGLRVLYGHKAGYAAIEKDAREYARYADSASLFLATTKSPIMYRMNDKVYIKPSGGTVVAVKFPTSITFSSTSIAGFPDDLESLAILGTAVKCRIRQLTDKRSSIPVVPVEPNLDLTVSTDIAGIAYTAPTALSIPVDLSIPALDADSGLTPPDYTKPTISLTTAPTISDLSISASVPTAPSAPSFAWVDAVAGTIAATTISALGTAPAYTKTTLSATTAPTIADLSLATAAPTALAAPSFTYTPATVGTVATSTVTLGGTAPVFIAPSISLTTAPVITDLNITAIAPSAPSSPSFTYSDAAATAASSVSITAFSGAPAYTKPTFTAPSFPSITALDIDPATNANITAPTDSGVPSFSYTAPVVGGATEELTGTLTALTGDAVGTDADFLDISKWWTAAGEFIEDEKDIALASAHIQKLGTYIGAYAQALQNQLATWNDAVKLYQEKRGRFSVGIANYQAQVNAEVQLFIQNEIQNKFNKYVTDYANLLREYQLDIQNELNEFSKENVAYQADIQKQIRQADLDAQRLLQDARQADNIALQNELQTLAEQVQEYSATIAAYSQDILSYRAQVSAEVQEYAINELQKQIVIWQTQRANELQKYSLDLQASLGIFNADNAVYQANLQADLKDADMAIQENLREGQMTTDVNIRNALQDLNQDIEEYRAKVARHASESAQYQAEVNAEIQEYVVNEIQLEVGIWKQERLTEIQEFGLNIQDELNEFNKENAYFLADLQHKIRQANLTQARLVEAARLTTDTNVQNEIQTLAEQVQEYGAQLGRYASQIQSYNAQVNAEVQEYVINEIQKELAVWQQERGDELRQYASDIQNNLADFNADFNVYRERVNLAINEFAAREGINVQDYQARVAAELGRYQAQMNNAVNAWQDDLAKHGAELQEIGRFNQDKLSNYGISVQAYSGELQRFNMEHAQMVVELKELKAEYERGLQMYGAVAREE